jgi:GWxTD domain-containing protein
MKRFFYSFWANRSVDPEAAWAAYRAEVIKVNRLFGCRVLKGYETDRGRVFLQYGPPNTMMDRFNDMGTLPYTIWHYYRAGKFTNRRFIFYQPDRVTNCFPMLHSEVPGELNNPQWNMQLHESNTSFRNVQSTDPNSLEGDRVREFFNDPR